MDIVAALKDLNYVGVTTAALASFAVGFGWYHWAVFGKAWAGLLGMTKEEADNTDGLGFTLLLAVVGTFIAAIFMAVVMSLADIGGLFDGAIFGAAAGCCLRFTSTLYHNGFSRAPLLLSVIDGAHDTTQLAMMGAIIATVG